MVANLSWTPSVDFTQSALWSTFYSVTPLVYFGECWCFCSAESSWLAWGHPTYQQELQNWTQSSWVMAQWQAPLHHEAFCGYKKIHLWKEPPPRFAETSWVLGTVCAPQLGSEPPATWQQEGLSGEWKNLQVIAFYLKCPNLQSRYDTDIVVYYRQIYHMLRGGKSLFQLHD